VSPGAVPGEYGPVERGAAATRAEEPVVTVLTRRDCSLCDKAIDAVRRICAELGVSWDSADVDGDVELRAEYGDRVPVIFIDGREHGYFAVEEDRFRAALSGRRSGR
jgi:glutaredoxin